MSESAHPFRHSVTSKRIRYEWVPSEDAVSFGEGVAEVFGGPLGSLLKLDEWIERIHPDDRVAFQHEFDVSHDSGGVFQLRYRVRRTDDTYVIIDDVAQYVGGPQGTSERLVGFMTDVTQRVKDERDIERQAAFARFNPNPVIELSASGSINFANASAYEMMEAFGEASVKEILPPNTADVLQQCVRTRKPVLRVEVAKRARTLSWSFFPIPDSVLVHCYGGDITDRRHLEEQLLHAQKMEALGLLAGGIAHDFNNLLTVIQAHTGLLREWQTVAPEFAASIDGIAQAADRAGDLTRQLLTFSRKRPLQMRVIDLQHVIRELAGLLQRMLGAPISIELALSPEPQWVKADVSMMEQVMLNLAVNARDAMPEGGKLRVEVSGGTASNARANDTSWVRWTVSDTGAGIAPEIRDRIFDPFFTTKEQGKGTGLGLATVYSIVEQHGGHIEVMSEPGYGATFGIRLPKSPVAGEMPVTSTTPAAEGGHETILVVEDELMVRSLLETALARAGYHVLVAARAEDAIALWNVHRDRVALLVTDLVMPGSMGGRLLAEKLQQDRPTLKVIMITGYSPDLAGDQPTLIEGVNFLSKPFDVETLLAAVRKNLDALAPRQSG